MENISSQTHLPLGNFQEQILFHLEQYGNDHSFNVPLLLTFKSKLEDGHYLEAINSMVLRFPELAAVLTFHGGVWGLRRTDRNCIPAIRHTNGDALSFSYLIKTECARPFDLPTGPLARITMIHHGDVSHVLCVFHHLIVDGYSLDLFKRVFEQAFSSSISDEFVSPLYSLGISCAAPDPVPNAFQLSSKGPSAIEYFDVPWAVEISDAAKDLRATVNELFFYAARRALKNIHPETHLVVGVPFANRTSLAGLNTTGCHTNVVPLACNIEPSDHLQMALKKVRNAFKTGFEAQSKSLSASLRDSQIRAPEILYSFRERNLDEERHYCFSASSEIDLFRNFKLEAANKIPLSILAERKFSKELPDSTSMTFSIEYDSSIYRKEKVKVLSESLLVYLLDAIDSNKSATLRLGMAAAVSPVPEYPIVGQVAIRDFDSECNVQYHTQHDIRLRIDKFKRQLSELGSKCVLLESAKTVDALCLIYACYELMICYVPIDGTLPMQRKAHIYEQSNVDTTAIQIGKNPLVLRRYSNHASPLPIAGIQYIIYTSGSSGKPKGVMVSRDALQNLIFGMIQALRLDRASRVLSYANIYFDMSVPDLYLPYFLGSDLSIFDDALKTRSAALSGIIGCVKPSVLQATPTALSLFDERSLSELEVENLVLGGEAVSKRFTQKSFERVKNVWNFYGPTEAVVWAGYGRMDDATAEWDLDTALPGYALEVVHAGRRCFPHETGELFIVGNLAEGYVDSQENIGRFFEPSPAEGTPRYYATGDLATLMPGNKIKILGRSDAQVKLNGRRIELEDIEFAIERLSGVKQATAYFDSANGCIRALVKTMATTDLDHIRQELRSALPEIMIPRSITRVSELPMNKNGKKERKIDVIGALIDVTKSADMKTDPGPASRSINIQEVEDFILSTFKNNLESDPTENLDASFYQLGGNSLSAIAITRALRARGMKASVAMLIDQRNIKEYIQTVKRTYFETP